MGNAITVLVTGGGAPGIAGTIYSIKNNPDKRKFKIITTDIKENVVGKYLSDKFYQIPSPNEENYIEILAKIAKKEEVDVILPQTTREIEILSKNKEFFKGLNIPIVVSDYESIKLANNKHLLLEVCKELNIPYPEYYLASSKEDIEKYAEILGYPDKKIVVKPVLSNGMRGLRILSSKKISIDDYLNKKPEGMEMTLKSFLDIFEEKNLKGIDFPKLLITEYLPGVEYTVDAFSGSQIKVIIPRLRKIIRSGITFEARVDLRKDIIEYSKKLSDRLKLKYCFGFQFKLSDDGTPKILESNPRVQGTMVTSTFAGFNMIYYSILEALGISSISESKIKIKNGTTFKRYWGGIGEIDGKLIGRV